MINTRQNKTKPKVELQPQARGSLLSFKIEIQQDAFQVCALLPQVLPTRAPWEKKTKLVFPITKFSIRSNESTLLQSNQTQPRLAPRKLCLRLGGTHWPPEHQAFLPGDQQTERQTPEGVFTPSWQSSFRSGHTTFSRPQGRLAGLELRRRAGTRCC